MYNFIQIQQYLYNKTNQYKKHQLINQQVQLIYWLFGSLKNQMYWIIDGLCFAGGIALFVLSFTQDRVPYCWVGPIWIAVYPILLQSIQNISSSLFSSKQIYTTAPRSHFVYNSSYNITFCGIENLHPFDSKKYGNIYHRLLERKLLTQEDTIVPDKPPRSLLAEVVSKWYLFKLCYTIPICKYIQMPLVFIPGFLLRWRVLDPMLRATQGSILAACLAQQLGWAVNLAGGYHHASKTRGGGFCVYPDITLIVHYLRTRLLKKRVMIVDLDAHQGNGYERDFLEDSDVYIIDFYHHNIYPGDSTAKKAISRDVSVGGRTDDHQYIQLVRSIRNDMEIFKPDFVIYNAGTDILENDPLGRMHISAKGIIERDQEMISMCMDNRIPVVMLLSGGYQMINAEIIANSLQNLLKKYK